MPDSHIGSWPDFDLPSICPICLAHHEATANTQSQSRPTDGDVTICIVCHGISVYDFTLPGLLRFPTDEELEVIKADPEIQRVQWAMGIVKDVMGPPKGDYWPQQDH
jgi:hypothetical protein